MRGAKVPPAPATTPQTPAAKRAAAKAIAKGTKKSAKPADGTGELRHTRFEGFEVRVLERRALKNAPYNPRVMDDKAKKKLRAGIGVLKLLAPVTWNETTGNLVGGHQRLAQLDALEGDRNYTLTVAVVRLSEVEEKEANLLLNNDEAQGRWDLAKLEEVFADGRIRTKATGFDTSDLMRLFGASPNLPAPMLAEMGDVLRTARETADKIAQATKPRDNQDFYLVLVWERGEEVDRFLEANGLPDNRFQNGRDFVIRFSRTIKQRDAYHSPVSSYRPTGMTSRKTTS